MAEMAAVSLLLLVSTMAAMLVALVVPSQREARWALGRQVRLTLVVVAGGGRQVRAVQAALGSGLVAAVAAVCTPGAHL